VRAQPQRQQLSGGSDENDDEELLTVELLRQLISAHIVVCCLTRRDYNIHQIDRMIARLASTQSPVIDNIHWL